jgi:hypothetical protein
VKQFLDAGASPTAFGLSAQRWAQHRGFNDIASMLGATAAPKAAQAAPAAQAEAAHGTSAAYGHDTASKPEHPARLLQPAKAGAPTASALSAAPAKGAEQERTRKAADDHSVIAATYKHHMAANFDKLVSRLQAESDSAGAASIVCAVDPDTDASALEACARHGRADVAKLLMQHAARRGVWCAKLGEARQVAQKLKCANVLEVLDSHTEAVHTAALARQRSDREAELATVRAAAAAVPVRTQCACRKLCMCLLPGELADLIMAGIACCAAATRGSGSKTAARRP